VLRIVLDKPDMLDAVNTPMLEAIRAGAGDDPVRVITLTGPGRALCAGSDLSGEETDGATLAAADGPTLSYRWIKRALHTATLSELGKTQAVEIEG